MAKDLSISLLLGFYGELLSDRQRDAAACYYDEDLSLAEIAQYLGITRQGVLDNLRHAEKKLRDYESKLGLAAKSAELSDISDELMLLARGAQDKQLRERLEALSERTMKVIGEEEYDGV